MTDSGGNVEVIVVRITMTEPSALVLEKEDTIIDGAGVMTVVMSPFGRDAEGDSVLNKVLVTVVVEEVNVVDDEDEEDGGRSMGGGFAGHCEKSVAVGENEVFWYTISTGTWTVVIPPAAAKEKSRCQHFQVHVEFCSTQQDDADHGHGQVNSPALMQARCRRRERGASEQRNVLTARGGHAWLDTSHAGILVFGEYYSAP